MKLVLINAKAIIETSTWVRQGFCLGQEETAVIHLIGDRSPAKVPGRFSLR